MGQLQNIIKVRVGNPNELKGVISQVSLTLVQIRTNLFMKEVVAPKTEQKIDYGCEKRYFKFCDNK